MMLVDELNSIVKKYVNGKEVAYYGKWRIPGVKETVIESAYALFINYFSAEKLKMLVSGGMCLVIFPNRAWFEKNAAGKDWEESDGEFRLIAWRYMDGKVWFRYVIPNRYEYEEYVEVKEPEELEKMLDGADLEVVKIISDIESESFDEKHPWLVALARKPIPKKEEMEKAVEESVQEKVEKQTAVGESKSVPEAIKLTWRDSNNKPHEIEIKEDLIIGRGKGDVIMMLVGEERYPTPMMLFDPNKKVSRRHIEIVHRDDGWYIRDLGSTNGTVLNGVLLPGWRKPEGDKRFPSEYVKLMDGDEIVLANSVSFSVRIPQIEASEKSERGEEPLKVEKTEHLHISWVDGNLMKQELEVGDAIQVGRDDRGIIRIITKDGKTVPMGLIDREKEISEKHFEIIKMENRWFVRDLGSENGTYLNGKPLEGWSSGVMSKPVEIKDGDEILFGKYMITVKFK